MAGWLATLGNVGKTFQTAQSVKKGLTKKKDKKKSGKEVASAITKRDPEEKKDAIIKSRTITISKEKLLNVAPPAEEPDTKKTSSGGPLVKVLDNINETFGGMIKATKDESKLAKTQQKDAARRDDKDKKKTREGVLEKIGKTGATMVGKATAPVKGMWETLKTFFGNILIGSILTMILENWNKIVEQIEKAVEKIKEVWKMLEPILTPIWDVGKWFFVEGVKLTAQLMGVENADTSPVTNNLSAIMKKIPFVGGLFENFLGVRKELEGNGPKDGMGGDENEQDASIKEEVEDAVVETKGRKTTGGDGVATADSSSGVMKSDESKDDAEGIEDVKKDKPKRRTGRTKRRRRRQTTSTQQSQIAGIAEGVPYTFQQELQGMIRRHKHRTEELNEAIQSGEGVESTQRRHARLTRGLIKYKNNNPKVFAQLSADDKKYINSLNNTSVNFNKDLSKSKTTSSLFQRDSTERKKSTVVMMQSSPPPGGGGGSGGGNGGGVQVVAIAPTKNEVVNTNMKALMTTQLA